MTGEEIGGMALERGVAVYELTAQEVSLEDAFMHMTQKVTEYEGSRVTPHGAAVGASA